MTKQSNAVYLRDPGLMHNCNIGTCESKISVRIESLIELVYTIWIQIESRIESEGSCLHVNADCHVGVVHVL